MGMVVNHNLPAINANRQLGINNKLLSKSIEKLSSGMQINRAADNAAGLAISEKMRGQINGLEQASKNAQDGISLIQTAEGALNETHDILQRMRTLAVQSANGTYQDEVDREAIQLEVDALKSEIDRISTSTHYNGIKLLDGSLSGSGVQNEGVKITTASIKDYDAASYSAGTPITTPDLSGIKAWTGTGANDAGTSHMVIDGKNVDVNWGKYITESADRAAIATKFADAGFTSDDGASVAKILENAINGAIDDSETGVNHVTVAYDATKGFSITSGLEGSAKSEITFKEEKSTDVTGIGVKIFGAPVTTTGATVGDKAINQTTDFTIAAGSKFDMVIDGNTIETSIEDGITAGTTLMFDNEGANAASTTSAAGQLKKAIDAAVDAYNTATGKSIDADKITVEASNDGGFKIVNKTGLDISFENHEGSKTASQLGLTDAAGATSGKGLTFQIGANGTADQRVTLNVDDMSSSALKVGKISVATRDKANDAIDVVDKAINTVSMQRAGLGALQNRLEHTINSLDVANENLTAAESAIRDTDMAKEMMKFTKQQILSQASQAMLAQANQLPQGVLQLLQ